MTFTNRYRLPKAVTLPSSIPTTGRTFYQQHHRVELATRNSESVGREFEENLRVAGIEVYLSRPAVTPVFKELLHDSVAQICGREEALPRAGCFDCIEEASGYALPSMLRRNYDKPNEWKRKELVVPRQKTLNYRLSFSNEHISLIDLAAKIPIFVPGGRLRNLKNR